MSIAIMFEPVRVPTWRSIPFFLCSNTVVSVSVSAAAAVSVSAAVSAAHHRHRHHRHHHQILLLLLRVVVVVVLISILILIFVATTNPKFDTNNAPPNDRPDALVTIPATSLPLIRFRAAV